MLRWFMQITAMSTDIVLLAMCIFIFFMLPWWACLPLVFITYKTWQSQGGLIAWTHRKQFMENAKKMGL